jgi:hypothetical protein
MIHFDLISGADGGGATGFPCNKGQNRSCRSAQPFAPKNETRSEGTGELLACTGYTRPGSCNDSIVASMIGCFAMPVNPSTRATSPARMGSASAAE